MRDLNEMATMVHTSNQKWWTDIHTGERITRNRGELLMLMVSELAEAMEGERKDLMDDKLTHRKCAEVEMADVVIRVLDYAKGFGYTLHHCSAPFNARPDANRAEFLLYIVRLIAGVNDWMPHFSVGLILSEVIAACDFYCEVFGYDLWAALDEKMNFNRTRVDHTHEARRAVGGKRW